MLLASNHYVDVFLDVKEKDRTQFVEMVHLLLEELYIFLSPLMVVFI